MQDDHHTWVNTTLCGFLLLFLMPLGLLTLAGSAMRQEKHVCHFHPDTYDWCPGCGAHGSWMDTRTCPSCGFSPTKRDVHPCWEMRNMPEYSTTELERLDETDLPF